MASESHHNSDNNAEENGEGEYAHASLIHRGVQSDFIRNAKVLNAMKCSDADRRNCAIGCEKKKKQAGHIEHLWSRGFLEHKCKNRKRQHGPDGGDEFHGYSPVKHVHNPKRGAEAVRVNHEFEQSCFALFQFRGADIQVPVVHQTQSSNLAERMELIRHKSDS